MSKTTEWLIKEIEKERRKNIGLENRLKHLKGDLDDANYQRNELENLVNKMTDAYGVLRHDVEFAARFDLPLHPTTNIQASTNLGEPREPDITDDR